MSRKAPKPKPPKFYPELLCHMAPLKPAPQAPLDGCSCRVCEFFRR